MLSCASCHGLTPQNTSPTCLHCDAPLRRPPRWALRVSALLGPVGAILLAACYGGPGGYYRRGPYDRASGATRVDHDRDGALGPWTCPPNNAACAEDLAHMTPPPDVDCDDNDPRRFPGAEDVEGDGVDQNCDGVDGWSDPATRAAPQP